MNETNTKPKDYLAHLRAIRHKNLRMFIEREELTQRTSIAAEKALFAMIQNGDINGINRLVEDSQMIAGKMSANSLRQAQYMAVSFIALATRVAIEGGVIETDAFSMSDYFIQAVDSQDTAKDVYAMIFEMMRVLAITVSEAQRSCKYSNCINKCIDYIFKNLHFKITICELSEHVNMSREHLSRLFHKETGKTIGQFIMEEKLKLAYEFLQAGIMGSQEIAHTLGFCSQSHFSSCFKKQFKITPIQLKKGI